MVDMKNSTAFSCRICSSKESRSMKINGKQIYYCEHCGITNNLTVETQDYEESTMKQVEFHDAWFNGKSEAELQEMQQEIGSEIKRVLAWTKDIRVPSDGNYLDFIDVGAGCGHFTSGLLNIGQKGIAVEPSHFLCSIAANVFKIDRANIWQKKALESICTLKKSNKRVRYAIFWHSLEHMIDFKETVNICKEILVDDGKIIIQLPGLLTEYIYPQHLFFIDEFSLENFGVILGLKLMKSDIDLSRLFFTGVYTLAKDSSRSIKTRKFEAFLEDYTDLLNRSIENFKN